MGLLVKACLNGARTRDDHPALPISAVELAADARAAVAAGAGVVHLHPRDEAGRERLEAAVVDPVVRAVRAACPQTPISVSTGAWIEPDPAARVRLVSSWQEPDLASVNLAEPGHRAVMAALLDIGIGVEAGLAEVADVEALVASGLAARITRVLVEVEDEDAGAAVARAAAIDAALDAAGMDAPRVHHGLEATTWPVLAQATRRGHGVRAGLEDSLTLPDGARAPDNAALVAAAGLIADAV